MVRNQVSSARTTSIPTCGTIQLTWLSLQELTYLAVDAEYARRGIGTRLVQWALDRCEAETCPAYVESTVEAVSFYEKLGFEVAGRISMNISEVTGNKCTGLYEEIACIYSPRSKAGAEV